MSHKRKQATAAVITKDDDLLPRRAFSVSGTPDFTESAPQTAEEYLRRVKWEARNQPRVFQSSIDPRRFDHLQTSGYVKRIEPLPHTSARVMPSAEWESAFALQFADIRQTFAHYSQLHPPAAQQPQPPGAKELLGHETLSTSRNCDAWARYCLGISSSPATAPSTATATSPSLPSLPTIAAFDQLTTRAVMAQIITHLYNSHTRTRTQTQQRQRNDHASTTTTTTAQQQPGGDPSQDDLASEAASVKGESDEEEEESGEDEIEESAVQSAASLSLSDASTSNAPSSSRQFGGACVLSASCTRWLYCLLAHLQKPLPSDTVGQLRQLYRVCGNIRAEAGKWIDQSSVSQTPDSNDEQQASSTRAAEETAMCCNLLLTIVDRIFGQRIPVSVATQT